ncbi:MAG: cobalt ECF transporter T component CbiQ [Gudongella sp.]|nr:cobalt ECF transporter T component CbiQ [Gudongella sp.]
MLPIDRYAYTNRMAGLDPGVKLSICAAAILPPMIVESHFLNGAIILMMLGAITIVGGIPLGFYLRMLLVPIGFLVLGFAGIAFSISMEDAFFWSVGVGPYHLGLTRESLEKGLLTVSRSSAAISGTFFLVLTTSADSIMRSLWKSPIPKVLLEIAMLTYRSIFIFMEEAAAISHAQEMRHGHDNIRKSYLSWSLLVRELFKRVIARYDSMVIALECRNYNGQFKMGD